jgi:hypothetical protein
VRVTVQFVALLQLQAAGLKPISSRFVLTRAGDPMLHNAYPSR